MVETTADVRRDIELTRERMATTLQQLEQKLNVKQVVRDNPWPALAIAVGAGVLLSRSRSDARPAEPTVAATRGVTSRPGSVLDSVVASLVGGLHDAFESRLISMVHDLKSAVGSSRPGTRAPTEPPPAPAPAVQMADRADVGGRPVDTVGGVQRIRAD